MIATIQPTGELLELDTDVLTLEELTNGGLFLKVTMAHADVDVSDTVPFAGITANCCRLLPPGMSSLTV